VIKLRAQEVYQPRARSLSTVR